jgi:hypothetical protein
VVAHKDRIREATDRLSDVIYKAKKELSKNLELSDENALAIRKIIHEIVSELSIIGGFCDSWTREYIDRTANIVGASVATKVHYVDVFMLEWWAVRINSLMVDFTKVPFRLSELKPIFSILKEALSKK